MPMTINNNITAMTAQRYLGVNAMNSATSLSKLSSGSRVPSAKFDAAGLAVGTQLKAEVAGLKQAGQNAGQAVSMLQIADGALATVSDILTRMKSLATQASSGQLSNADRALLDQEFESLKEEVGRIAADTDFNGTKLLNGGDVVAEIAVESRAGYLAGKGIAMEFDTAELGADDVFRVEYDWTDAATDVGNLKVTNLTTGENQTIDIAALVQAKTGEAGGALTTDLAVGQTVDVAFTALGVTLKLDDRFDVGGVGADFNASVTPVISGAQLGGAVTVDFLAGTGNTGANFATLAAGLTDGKLRIEVNSTGVASTVDIAATTGAEFSLDGVTFSSTLTGVAVATNDDLYVRAGGAGSAFMRVDLTSLTSTTTAATDGYIEVDLSGMFRATESVSSAATFDFRVGTGAVTVEDEISITIDAVTTAGLGINASDISTQGAAETAMDAVTDAISTISERRADVGALQSRLDFATAAINVSIENVSAAQSAILDVDVSAEMTEFTSKQVLLQAGISMLAQANQQPALLLRLLQ
ncbi:MAG: flagellin [Alphaproteobacteria bacterium]